jgi:uncharacterized OB-fold protein
MSTTTIADVTVLEHRLASETARPPGGVVYTDTVVFSAPEAFVNDVPYQLAIIDLDEGGRLTVRIHGDNVVVGDRVEYYSHRDGIPFFRKPI